MLGRVEEVRQREAGDPLAEPLGAVGGEEAGERGRDERGRALQEHALPRSNARCGNDDLGLVRAARTPSAGCDAEGLRAGDDHGGDRVAEVVGRGPPRRATAAAERRDLAVERPRASSCLAAREAAVDGGPGAAGLAGDVVERGLGEPDPGDAGERRVEDPRLAAGRRCGHH